MVCKFCSNLIGTYDDKVLIMLNGEGTFVHYACRNEFDSTMTVVEISRSKAPLNIELMPDKYYSERLA